MITGFKTHLISKGYKEFTPSGNPSTVYDYCKRVQKVCEWEGYYSLDQLSENISQVLQAYEEGGIKADLGAKSHNAVRCALRAYRDYIKSKKR